MPTYEALPQFLRDFKRLSPQERELFLGAVRQFVTGLRAGQIPPSLRLRAVQREPGVFEMTWGPMAASPFPMAPKRVRENRTSYGAALPGMTSSGSRDYGGMCP